MAQATEGALLSAIGGVLSMRAIFRAVGAAAALVRGDRRRVTGMSEPASHLAPVHRGA
jgi:hypothetical protein